MALDRRARRRAAGHRLLRRAAAAGRALGSGQRRPPSTPRWRRVLTAKFELGLFEQPFVEPDRVGRGHRHAGAPSSWPATIARKSLVLLRNDGMLPLRPDIGSVAVIGPNADDARHLFGDYTYPAHVESLQEVLKSGRNVFAMPIDDRHPLDHDRRRRHHRRRRAPGAPRAEHVRSLAAATSTARPATASPRPCDLAAGSDVVVLVMGDKAGLTDDCTSGESRDVASLDLPGVQEDLARAVIATGTPVVLVLVAGRPVASAWLHEHCAAVLMAWLPGQEGADADRRRRSPATSTPSGKLPISYPRSSGQIPVYYGHKVSGGRSHWKGDYVDSPASPLYPFGHGLSYTTFTLTDAALARSEVGWHDSIATTVTVTNDGDPTRRRGRPAVRARPDGERHPTGARAQGIRAGRARGRRVEDRDVRDPGRPARLLRPRPRLRRRARRDRRLRRHVVGGSRRGRSRHRDERIRPGVHRTRCTTVRSPSAERVEGSHGRVLHRRRRADPVRGSGQRQPAGLPLVRRRPRRRRAADGGPPPLRRLLLALVQLGRLRHLRRRHARPPVAPDVRPDGRSARGGARRRWTPRSSSSPSSACRSTASTTATSRPRAARSRSRRRCSTRWSTWPPSTRSAPASQLLWGTANLFSNPRYQAGAATNPDPEVFAYAAAQVAHCLEATHRLGGHNYVLWGGREGYETLLNTDLRRELDQLARFLTMVVEHKQRIGFTGTILIEPKPFEPTKHQYDYDVAAVHAFLQRYDLADEIKVNIEVNHATLSGPRLRPRDRRRRRTPASSGRSTPTPATTGWAGTSTASRCRSSR